MRKTCGAAAQKHRDRTLLTQCAPGHCQVMIQVGIQKARLPPLHGAPPALEALVDQCTAADASARPSFAKIERQLAELIATLPADAWGHGCPQGPLKRPWRGAMAMARSKSAGSGVMRPGRPALGTLGEGSGFG